jgi:hypothetical protein
VLELDNICGNEQYPTTMTVRFSFSSSGNDHGSRVHGWKDEELAEFLY